MTQICPARASGEGPDLSRNPQYRALRRPSFLGGGGGILPSLQASEPLPLAAAAPVCLLPS